MDAIVFRLNSVIKYSKMTVNAFAMYVGIHPQNLYKCINGRCPNLKMVQKILAAFPEISSEWLIMGRGEMISPAFREFILRQRKERLSAMGLD